MDVAANSEDVQAQAEWFYSEDRLQRPEALDLSDVDPAESDPEDDGGGDNPTPRHGIGPATVVMALASAGFRGPITAVCLQGMVEMVRDRGVAWMVEQVIDDPGLSIVPNAKWWFCKAQIIPADDAQIRKPVRKPSHPKLPAEPLKQVLENRSLKSLARQLAQRFGTKPESECRQLERIQTGEVTAVCESTADRIVSGLGFHLLDVYPSWR